MKFILLFILLPFFGWAQYQPNQKLYIKTTLLTDSGVIKGYFMQQGDSAIILSNTKRYSAQSNISIPINSIQEMHLKNNKVQWAVVTGVSVLGFLVTAGLIQNNDYNNDGKTSFFELIWSAIEGTTSANRSRRNASLIAGAAGGTAGLLVSLFSGRKFSLIFPLQNRNSFYSEKNASVINFVKF